MPGMNMDPMNMYGGFGGQGMGINGVNMGMSMDFNGQGGFDQSGWNVQASTWGGSHNNFNPNTNGGSSANGIGDQFGINNPGYHQHHSTGANGQFANQYQANNFRQNAQYGRGRTDQG